jgi:hypothetical protein
MSLTFSGNLKHKKIFQISRQSIRASQGMTLEGKQKKNQLEICNENSIQ